ncbi:hypothetical protein [Deinococcus soli (ex Cha et al. 2016)]|uniref:Uncharacterized protein n=1 Tax=Deinococcus soli (ex Cha et al. 2016) TaxID=1309411 RepID=A0ACC6KLS6_9DEIO|nr:hypothetical protein [Deinococcus soli (ex Cha et al. 2016)]MDR6753456.1 hypothetical protein [Deinococcus soli (ex Cha et al. 2016)]
MKPPALTTQQLKERGWTPAMIRELLGKHDRERANELRVGNRGRRVDAPVKLYLEERVVKAESTAAFARAQDAARVRQDSANQGAETRAARQQQQADAFVDAYTPNIVPPENATAMTRTELWRHHMDGLDEWQYSAQADALLGGLRGKQRRDAQNRLYAKHRAAVHAVYGWTDEQ